MHMISTNMNHRRGEHRKRSRHVRLPTNDKPGHRKSEHKVSRLLRALLEYERVVERLERIEDPW